jgi:hypothetical protein
MENDETTVIDDPDLTALPIGCINAQALIDLAKSMRALEEHHKRLSGSTQHTPCLRRIESSDGKIVAHVSTGPAVGGSWHRLVYSQAYHMWSFEL